jgi:putative transposase
VVALRRGDHCSILEGGETQEIEEETVAEDNMDLLAWLRKQLAEAEADLLREMVKSLAEALMGAEADALCGAAFRERSGERVNRRNGHMRWRRW